jgi:hypothetical protein
MSGVRLTLEDDGVIIIPKNGVEIAIPAGNLSL